MTTAAEHAAAHREGEGPAALRYHGKYPAVVIDNEPDGNASHRGDLLVAVPAILEEQPSQPEEDDLGQFGIETSRVDKRRPIRVLAKPCFAPGAFFLPEPGHHVWVEFAAGDVNEPVWCGVWLPEGATPETSDDQPPTAAQRVIRSTSGHVIEFDDEEGDERLVIRDRNGSKIVFNEQGIHVATRGGIEVEATNLTLTCEHLTVNGTMRVCDGASSTVIAGNEIKGELKGELGG